MLNKIFALLLILILLPVLLFIFFFIFIVTFQNPIHFSKRIGRDNKIFFMPKFRTMKTGTPQLATHLMTESNNYLYFYSSFLRKTSIDEIPQLFSVLRGDLNFIGLRPALFNQNDLIELRRNHNLLSYKPGVTGWAQVNGRDNLDLQKKVEYELYYYNNKSLLLDIKIIYLTFIKLFSKNEISH